MSKRVTAPDHLDHPDHRNHFSVHPIGSIHSCYTSRFGIPCQSGLVTEAEAEIRLLPEYGREEAFKALPGFSHIWVIFLFHACLSRDWKPQVRPPRLGGNRKVGVFASRSPIRPNPIGLSAVELVRIEARAGTRVLRVRGGDFLDGTPVLDIKPYIPYADAWPDARAGFATRPPPQNRPVTFSARARDQIRALDPEGRRRLLPLIRQILAQDPRPAYLDGRSVRAEFGMRLFGWEVRWRVEGDGFLVVSVSD